MTLKYPFCTPYLNFIHRREKRFGYSIICLIFAQGKQQITALRWILYAVSSSFHHLGHPVLGWPIFTSLLEVVDEDRVKEEITIKIVNKE